MIMATPDCRLGVAQFIEAYYRQRAPRQYCTYIAHHRRPASPQNTASPHNITTQHHRREYTASTVHHQLQTAADRCTTAPLHTAHCTLHAAHCTTTHCTTAPLHTIDCTAAQPTRPASEFASRRAQLARPSLDSRCDRPFLLPVGICIARHIRAAAGGRWEGQDPGRGSLHRVDRDILLTLSLQARRVPRRIINPNVIPGLLIFTATATDPSKQAHSSSYTDRQIRKCWRLLPR